MIKNNHGIKKSMLKNDLSEEAPTWVRHPKLLPSHNIMINKNKAEKQLFGTQINLFILFYI